MHLLQVSYAREAGLASASISNGHVGPNVFDDVEGQAYGGTSVSPCTPALEVSTMGVEYVDNLQVLNVGVVVGHMSIGRPAIATWHFKRTAIDACGGGAIPEVGGIVGHD